VFVLATLPQVLDLTLGKVWVRGSLISAGGSVGQAAPRALLSAIGRSGTLILLILNLLIGALLIRGISIRSLLHRLLTLFLDLGDEISYRWALFRRRKSNPLADEAFREPDAKKPYETQGEVLDGPDQYSIDVDDVSDPTPLPEDSHDTPE